VNPSQEVFQLLSDISEENKSEEKKKKIRKKKGLKTRGMSLPQVKLRDCQTGWEKVNQILATHLIPEQRVLVGYPFLA